jgi:hypothetical protein
MIHGSSGRFLPRGGRGRRGGASGTHSEARGRLELRGAAAAGARVSGSSQRGGERQHGGAGEDRVEGEGVVEDLSSQGSAAARILAAGGSGGRSGSTQQCVCLSKKTKGILLKPPAL